MIAHTPGPWTAQAETDYRRAEVTHGDRQDPVAEVYGRSRDERQANARLIAAAPEMYAALKEVQARYRQYAGKAINAAIAKAEGVVGVSR